METLKTLETELKNTKDNLESLAESYTRFKTAEYAIKNSSVENFARLLYDCNREIHSRCYQDNKDYKPFDYIEGHTKEYYRALSKMVIDNFSVSKDE